MEGQHEAILEKEG